MNVRDMWAYDHVHDEYNRHLLEVCVEAGTVEEGPEQEFLGIHYLRCSCEDIRL